MREYIPAEVVEARFRENEKQLDQSLALCRSALASRGVEIVERSNRGGFEKSGFPYFVWGQQFIQESRTGALVERTMVEITFQQPGVSGTSENVTCVRTAERFWIGSDGPRNVCSNEIPLAAFLAVGIDDLVNEQMTLALRELLAMRGGG